MKTFVKIDYYGEIDLQPILEQIKEKLNNYLPGQSEIAKISFFDKWVTLEMPKEQSDNYSNVSSYIQGLVAGMLLEKEIENLEIL